MMKHTRRALQCLLLIATIMVTLNPALSVVTASLAAAQDAPATSVAEDLNPAPTDQPPIAPTPEPALPTDVPVIPTEIPSPTSAPVPTAEPTNVPLPTEVPPTIEPTTPPINTDALDQSTVVDGLSLQPEEIATYSITYQVTTARLETQVTISLVADSGTTDGWQVRIISLDGAGEDWSAAGSIAMGTDASATDVGGIFTLTIAVRAPALLVAPTKVSVEMESAVALEDGMSETGVASGTRIASVNALPNPTPTTEPTVVSPTQTATSKASPVAAARDGDFTTASITNGDATRGTLRCTSPGGRQKITPSGTLVYTCVYTIKSPPLLSTLVSTTISIVGSPPAGWTAVLSQSVFSSPTGTSQTFSFTVTVTAPSNAINGTVVTTTLASSALFNPTLGGNFSEASAPATLATTVGPVSVDNNNQEIMQCTPPSTFQLAPGGQVSVECTAHTGLLNLGALLGSLSFTITAPGNGWQVIISNKGLLGGTNLLEFTDGPTTGSATYSVGLLDILQLADMRFRVTLIAPTVVTESTVQSASVVMAYPGSPTSATTVFDGITALTPVTSDSNGLVTNLLLDLTCVPISGQTVAPGSTLSFNCTLGGLASLQLGGHTLADLSPTIVLGASPGWTTTITQNAHVFSGQGGVSLATGDVLSLDLLNSPNFRVDLSPACTTPVDTLIGARVTATLNLSVLGILNLGLVQVWSNLPTKVAGSSIAVAPSISATDANFGTYSWNGTSYGNGSVANPSLTLTTSPPIAGTGCAATQWHVNAVVTTPMSGPTVLPASAVTYRGPAGVSAPVSLDVPRTVVSGSAAVTAPAGVPVYLTFTPPSTAPPGTYTGTITFTASTGP